MWLKSDNIVPKRKGMCETKVDNQPIERESLITRRVLRSGSVACSTVNCDKNYRAVKKKGKSAAREGDLSNGDNIVPKRKEMCETEVDNQPIERESLIPRRVLRSGSVASDTVNSDNNHRAVKKKGKSAAREGDPSNGDTTVKVIDRGSGDEVKEVKQEHVKSLTPEEIHGDDFRSQIKVAFKDGRSDDENGSFEPRGKEMGVLRKRGRLPNYGISCESYDNRSISNCKFETSLDNMEKLVRDYNGEKLIGGSYFNEEKLEAKLEQGEYAKAKEILGTVFRSQVKVETEDDRSYDENGNVEPHNEGFQLKRKRGRPRKFHITSQSDESSPNTNYKLARTSDLGNQSSVDRSSLKRLSGRSTKTKETTVGLYIEKENVSCRHGSPLIIPDQIMIDSIDGSRIRRPTSSYKPKVPESDGRKMVRKRGRPTLQKKRKSGETDQSDCKAKKTLKLCKSPL